MKLEQTISGLMGRGHQLTIEESDRTYVENSATVDVWFMDIPGQAVAWRNYLLAIYHLRDIPGVKAAEKSYPGVTHELILVALDPGRNPQMLDIESWRHLVPINFVIQLELPSDEKAKELLYLAAKGVVDGLLWAEPPLSGQREPWMSSMLQTSAHLRGEAHAGHPKP